ncbi:MAG: DNA polymerase III subunit beta [Rhizobiales bacterium]|nr:DNA polymerase III subunit beta [Hyphomicrobiales bacterium]
MEAILQKNQFLKALTHVQNVVERRNTIPILANILIIAEGVGLKLIATDLDIELIEEIDAKIEKGGSLTAPAHLVYDIIRKLPDSSEITLSKDDNQDHLTIRSGKSNFKLQTLPRTDFPEISDTEFSHGFTIVSGELYRLIEKTRFAISNEETRYYLNGIYFHESKPTDEDKYSTLRTVSTDGHRLAQAELTLPEGALGMPGIIIPRKTIAELQKLTLENDGDVEVKISENKLKFVFNSIEVTSKVIDGTFPDYQRVIPFQNDKIMSVKTSILTNAVDRVATLSSERGRAIKLSLKDNSLTLSVTSPEAGTAIEEISVDFKGDDFEIGFNSKYLLDILSQLSGDSVKLLFSEPNSPCLVLDPSDEATLYVLMPMRV